MTDDIFLELIDADEFKNQNGSKASKRDLDVLKDSLSAWYTQNHNIGELAYNKAVNRIMGSKYFEDAADAILKSKFLTVDIFEHALKNNFLGDDREKWYSIFEKPWPDNTLKLFIDRTQKEQPSKGRRALIMKQKLSRSIIDYLVIVVDDPEGLIIDLVGYNQDIDEKTFLKVLKNLDIGELISYTGERGVVIGIERFISLNRNFFEEPYNWEIISMQINDLEPFFRAKIYNAILAYEDVSRSVLDCLADDNHDDIWGRIVENNDLHAGNMAYLYEKTGRVELLPDDIKEIFIF